MPRGEVHGIFAMKVKVQGAATQEWTRLQDVRVGTNRMGCGSRDTYATGHQTNLMRPPKALQKAARAAP